MAEEIAMTDLVLFNGRMSHPYEHGYVAARSAADAARLLQEHCGGHGWEREIREYWSRGVWGNSMIGVKRERGVYAEKKGPYPRQVVRIEHGNEIPVTRGPEWQEHLAKEKADREAAEAKQRQEHETQRSRMFAILEKLPFEESIVSPSANVIEFNLEGRKYELREVEK